MAVEEIKNTNLHNCTFEIKLEYHCGLRPISKNTYFCLMEKYNPVKVTNYFFIFVTESSLIIKKSKIL